MAKTLGTLTHDDARLPSCDGWGLTCDLACRFGDAPSCLSRAYRLQKDPDTEAVAADLFRRACLDGLANACTNYAAAVRAFEHTAAELACASEIFEKGCLAGEPFACGMMARLALEDHPSPETVARARQTLEQACDELRGFPCRVLAKHLEAGDFGSHDGERIPALLRRACEGGDRDACGEPATAAETFHAP